MPYIPEEWRNRILVLFYLHHYPGSLIIVRSVTIEEKCSRRDKVKLTVRSEKEKMKYTTFLTIITQNSVKSI